MVLSEQAMREKMRQGGSTAPGLSQGQPMMADPGGGALPAAQPAWHPPMAPPSQPALPASPSGQPNGATPASGGQPSGGAGNSPQQTPLVLLSSADPEVVIKNAETSAKAAAKSGATDDPQADQQKKQLAESMAAQGMDPVKAYNELKDQYMTTLDQRHEKGEITRKQHSKMKDRWKNIFNVVPEEDFGLFLMDFGLRLAAHSASNSFGGAFGQAGVEALGGVQERKRYDEQSALARDEVAHKRALDVAGLGQKQQELGILERRAKADEARANAVDRPVESTGGFLQKNDKGVWEYITVNGETPKPFSAAGMPYSGEKAYLYDKLKAAHPDWSDAQLMDKVMQGASAVSVEDRDQWWRDEFKAARDAFAQDESGKRFKDYSTAEREAWIKEQLHAQDRTRNAYEAEAASRQSGALPPAQTTPPRALTPEGNAGDRYLK